MKKTNQQKIEHVKKKTSIGNSNFTKRKRRKSQPPRKLSRGQG